MQRNAVRTYLGEAFSKFGRGGFSIGRGSAFLSGDIRVGITKGTDDVSKTGANAIESLNSDVEFCLGIGAKQSGHMV